jgi:hypothetical protein
LLLALSVASVSPQGQLVFNNRVNNVVVAPVYGIDPVDASVARRGNTPSGTPPGFQTYNGAPLSGAGFTAQLFGGSTRALRENLQPLTPATTFRTGDSAGFVVAPGVSLTVPGVPEGVPAKVILRVWDNRDGTRTNWAQVAGKPDAAKGESWAFITPPLGGPSFAPPNLIGLESFNLSTGGIRQAGIKVNFQTANAPVPLGYRMDAGESFTAYPDGLAYGWNFDHAVFASDRNATNSPDQQHDTFIDVQTNSFWEIALSNGLYGVHVSLGDPLRTNVIYRIEAESAVLFEGPPFFRGRWLERDELVWVNDGRLTLRAASANTPLCFVEIAPVDRPLLQLLSAPSSPGVVRLSFQGEVGIRYQIQSSSDLITWLPLGIAANGSGDLFHLFDTNSAGSTRRFYRAALPSP